VNTGKPEVRTQIVIATLAERSRADLLVRAIRSVCDQGASAIVVINGSRFDVGLRERLGAMDGISLIYVEQPGFPNAVMVGRNAVTAAYFGFLDDDDYLLPGSIALREGYLDAHPEADVVVTNGIREEFSGNQQLYESEAEVDRIRSDPLSAILQRNWMTPCGPLYRAASVPPAFFEGLTRYAEWTDVGFRLLGTRQIHFLYDLTFFQANTPASLSKSANQGLHTLALHYRIVDKIKSKRHRKLWNRRVCNQHHQIAEDALAEGKRLTAVKHHVYSVLHSWGSGAVPFLPYTARLILKLLARRPSSDND
jgi:glycosyltransferase involved in cell wall biosynthesis